MNYSEVEKKFVKLFNTEPLILKAPGRINLIGEHTDYNNGFVLPATINKNIYFAIQKNNNKNIQIYAVNFNESISIPIENITKNEKTWANYLLGSFNELIIEGFALQGFDCVFGGDIPIGAGLSSSAAIECGLIFGLNTLYNLNLDNLQIANLAQRAENNFVGVNCGIMDQFAITHGVENKLIKLDCKSLEATYHPYGIIDYVPVFVNSNVKHSLASSEYNIRRKECEQGVQIIQDHIPELESLRDITLNEIKQLKKYFNPKIYDRCIFVIEENMRVNQFCKVLEDNNPKKAGELIYESHIGLRDKYEVSCPELDFLVEEAMQMDFVLGSRMMGGGFGGCTLNLVKKDKKEIFIERIKKAYINKSGIAPDVYSTEITNGLEIINTK